MPESTAVLTVTTAALEQIKSLRDADARNSGKSLRIFSEGCCCQPEFGLHFDDPQPGDIHQRVDGVLMVMDADSSAGLEGAVLDYEAGSESAGFTLSNPRKSDRCSGC
jgi:iron-sulfur cluster assembly accessory protein